MGDLFLNIGATALFNLVIQFALYPYLNKTLGKEMYGDCAFYALSRRHSLGSCGTAANYSRLVSEKTLRPSNGDYNLFLLVGGILCAAVGLFYLWWIKLLTPITAILFAALLIVTAFRYYSDVEFKLKTSFVRYFFFYLAISVGYLLGLLVYRKTNQWVDRPSDGRNFRPRLCGLCKQDLPSSPLAPLSKLRTRPEKHFFSSPFQPSGKPHVKRRPPAPIFFRGRNGGLRLLYGVSFRKSRSAAHRPRQFGNHQLSDPLRQGAVEKNVERLYHRRNCLRRNLFRRMSPVFGAYSAAFLQRLIRRL